jgi:hypothetical protein
LLEGYREVLMKKINEYFFELHKKLIAQVDLKEIKNLIDSNEVVSTNINMILKKVTVLFNILLEYKIYYF